MRVFGLFVCYELVLGQKELFAFWVTEKFEKNEEESVRVEVQEPGHESFICAEAHDIHHVETPTGRRQITLRELLPLKE